MNKGMRQGETYVWAASGAVCLTLLMVALLIGLVMVNGLGLFWPAAMARMELTDGSVWMGPIMAREDATPPTAPNAPEIPEALKIQRHNLQVKVGNRDLYGQDFRWIKGETIRTLSHPEDAVLLERLEYGNFHGFLESVNITSLPIPYNTDGLFPQLQEALPLARERRETLEAERENLAGLSKALNAVKSQLARETRAPPGKGARERSFRLEKERDALTQRYGVENARIAKATAQLKSNTALFRDAGGKSKQIPLADIVRAVRPNRMSVGAKMGIYASKVWELLSDEPRESNTEGGLFPAIFGTVMMVMLMSLFSLPMGVVAAIYLREYAREGVMVRLVRIAVYNLAGVPSIVFGVFGLGFFVYGLGSGLDSLFFADRLPTPTFGTGGILWASLTLALLTVPVVIVATEEGLSAIPRSIREGSLALGATRFQTLTRVILPMAVPGILTGFILAMARAAGEVAPLMITGVVKLAPALPIDGTFPFLHLERKFMHLGFHIYDVGFQSPNVEAAKPMVYMTTLLLVLIVLVLSLTAIILRNRMRKRMQGAAF